VDSKDLFSKKSADYSRYRPTYPSELFRYLATLTSRHALAWDCGTGNGQAAVELAAYFESVEATDLSEKQLAQALANPKVTYRQAKAEQSGLQPDSVDLITVAQAFHWFDHPRFFDEARRVAARSESVLAIWSYALLRMRPDIDLVLRRYYVETVGPYWEPERRHVDEAYARVQFPFPELKVPAFEMKAEWTREHLLAYLATWSATQAAERALSRDPLEEVRAELSRLWTNGKTLTTKFDFTVRAFKLY